MNCVARNGKWVLTMTPQEVERNRKFGFVASNGVVWDEELAGSAGMSFVLAREPGVTPAMLAAAKAELHRKRDVVRISVAEVMEDEQS